MRFEDLLCSAAKVYSGYIKNVSQMIAYIKKAHKRAKRKKTGGNPSPAGFYFANLPL